MITPSEVRIARSLLARKASMATDRVSRTSIMARPSGVGSSAFFQPLQGFPRVFVFRIQFERCFIFFDCWLRLALVLVQSSDPFVRAPSMRVVVSHRTPLDIFAQQCFGLIPPLFF